LSKQNRLTDCFTVYIPSGPILFTVFILDSLFFFAAMVRGFTMHGAGQAAMMEGMGIMSRPQGRD
jgi:hypothetical protein